MHRSPLMERLGLRSKARGNSRKLAAHLAIEPLEERRLLTAYNLLVSTYDPTVQNLSGVLKYSEATDLARQALTKPLVQLPFGAYAGTGIVGVDGSVGLESAAGVAVAPDGSTYVSSPGSGPGRSAQILHYSSSGVFLNVLGGNDAEQAPLFFPGTLAFGPNGNLYVADLGGSFTVGGVTYSSPGSSINSTPRQPLGSGSQRTRLPRACNFQPIFRPAA